jgi:DNA-binding MarR family transcriptional regulator
MREAGREANHPSARLFEKDHVEALTPTQVRWLIRTQRLRAHYLGLNLFGPPCWDLLLELLLARVEHRQMQASSVGICADIPSATAHRWLERLVDSGLVVRKADTRDGRRVLVELSDFAVGRIESYLDAVYSVSRGSMLGNWSGAAAKTVSEESGKQPPHCLP